MKILKPVGALFLTLLLLTGCSSANSIDLANTDGGDFQVTIELPNFALAGEEGEHSEENWEEFAEIADLSRLKLMESGGTEYYSMLSSPYAMIYDPNNKAGDYWVAYYYPEEETGAFQYDLFEMTAYNAVLELYLYDSVDQRPLSGSQALKNPDGSYTVVVESKELKIRYMVKDGLISGAAVFAEGTFLGYTEITYGIDDELRQSVSELYELALASGETFIVPEDKKIDTGASEYSVPENSAGDE